MFKKPLRSRRLLILASLLVLLAGSAVVLWPTLRVTNYLTQARRALDLGDPEGALKSLEVAARIPRRRAAVQYLTGVAKRRHGRSDESMIHLRRAADLGWNPADIERQVWLASAQRGDLPEVRQQLLEAVESALSDEATEEIYEAFAKGCLSTYQLHDAWMCVDIWLQWRPQARQALLMRAAIHEQLGDYQDACDDYRTVLEGAPEHREARIRLAQALMILQRYDEAQVEFETRLAADPHDPEALLGLAQIERRAGHLTEARGYLDRALGLTLTTHQRGSALGELGRVLLEDGQAQESLEPLRLALALVPGNSQFHHALGTALARLGQVEEAAYHHARMQRLRDQFDRVTEITRRLATDPGNANLRCEAGAIMMEAGLKKEGADWLRTALRCEPDHRTSHELLATYFTEIGNHSLAGRHRLLAAYRTPGAGDASPPAPDLPVSDPPVSDRPESVPSQAEDAPAPDGR